MSEHFFYQYWLPFSTIFIFIIIPLILILGIPFVARWDLKNNYKNFEVLANLLNTSMKSGFMAHCLVKGNYSDREVIAHVLWGMNSPWVVATTEMEPKRIPTRINMELSIKPLKQYEVFAKSYWRFSPYRIRKITDKTWLFSNGKIYYTRVSCEDLPFQWIYWKYPKLSYEKHKDSLLALFALSLNESDVKAFLDELVKAALIYENNKH